MTNNYTCVAYEINRYKLYIINAKCAVPESVSVFFFLGGLSSVVLHLLLLNFWMPVPSLGMWDGIRRTFIAMFVVGLFPNEFKPWFFDDAAA